MVLLCLEFLKNIGVFIYYYIKIRKDIEFTYILIMSDIVIESLVLIPFSFYYAYMLYRTLNAQNDDTVF